MRGIIQTAFGFVTNFDFTQFGKKIGDAINGFFEDMGKVDARTGLTGWQELGKTISDSIKGILDTINTALSIVKWSEVGKSIGQFLGSIDWTGIIGKVGSVIANALFSAIKIAISAFTSDPTGVSKTFTTALTAILAYKKIKKIDENLKKTMTPIFENGIKNGIKAVESSKIGSALTSKIGSIGGLAISITFATVSFKFASDTWKKVFDKYSADEISSALKEMFADSINGVPGYIVSYVTGAGIFGVIGKAIVQEIFGEEFGKALSTIPASVFKGLGTIFSGKYSISEWGNGIKEMFIDWGNKAVDGANTLVNKVKPYFTKEKWRNIGAGIKGGIKEKWNELVVWFSETAVVKWWGKIKSYFTKEKWKENIGSIKNAFVDKWSSFTSWWSETAIANWWNDVRNKFSIDKWDETFKHLPTAFKNAWNSAISAIKKIWNTFANSLNSKLKLEIPNIEVAGKKIFDSKTLDFGKLPTFQTGGFPEDGLFLANHNELVGQFSNGKTAVANNDQIVKGIAEGIGPVVYAAMKQALSEMPQQGSGDVYLDTTKVTKEIMGRAEQISRSRGSGWKLA